MSETSPTERLTEFAVVKLPGYMIDDLEPGKLYVIQGTEIAKQIGPSVSFLCPCGCGKEVYLPCRVPGTEHRKYGPEWELTVHEDGTVTTHPSILDRGTCQSHYWIKRNQVEWC